MKKWQTALLAAALCPALLLTGCAKPAEDSVSSELQSSSAAAQPKEMTLQLAVVEGAYNPYLTSNTVTAQNALLLFEPFVKIDPNMELQYRLAERVSSENGLVTIQLRSGCTFADGSPVTAEDAAASLRAAKTSAAYGGRFAHVTDVQAADETTVVVTLSSPDSLFAYLLDIPVLKAGEVSSAQPTAGGRYTYGSNGAAFVQNPLAPFPEAGPTVIRLTAVNGHDELISGLAMGALDLYAFEESAGANGGISSDETFFKTNHLIFLGINSYSGNPLCNTAAGRVLLSSLLDRHQLATHCYDSRAYPATGLINRFYPCVRDGQTIPAEADPAALEQTMAQLGYAWDDASGLYTNSRGQPASVRLLLYGDNSYKRYTAQLLQRQWSEYGIQVTLEEVDRFENYLTAVQSGEFELYIGEVKLYNNMDMSVFWNGSARAGLNPSETLLSAYAAFRADAASAPALEAAFAAEMPFVPLLWKNGSVTVSRRVTGLVPSLSDAFYSLQQLAEADR